MDRLNKSNFLKYTFGAGVQYIEIMSEIGRVTDTTAGTYTIYIHIDCLHRSTVASVLVHIMISVPRCKSQFIRS